MWIRNTAANHGNVFLNCKFSTIGDVETVLARSPTNHGINYPFCEAVLINCALEGIKAEGWGPVGGETSNVHYWEYNSTNISDGKPVDTGQRHPASRQLNMENDSMVIADYSNPAFVLGGWRPKMAPLILSQPKAIKTKTGKTVELSVRVAAIPEANFQWYLNDNAINGAINSVLSIDSVSADDVGTYQVIIKNGSGNVTSHNTTLTLSNTK